MLSTFIRKSCRLWDNVQKYGTAWQATGDNNIWRMRFLCWVNNSTDTHSENVIVVLPITTLVTYEFWKFSIYSRNIKPMYQRRCMTEGFFLLQCHHMSFLDFVFLPPGHGRSVIDFWCWDAHEAQLRCPDGVRVVIEDVVPGGALNLKSTNLPRPWSARESSPSRKIPTVEPGIEPGTSWLVVRNSDH